MKRKNLVVYKGKTRVEMLPESTINLALKNAEAGMPMLLALVSAGVARPTAKKILEKGSDDLNKEIDSIESDFFAKIESLTMKAEGEVLMDMKRMSKSNASAGKNYLQLTNKKKYVDGIDDSNKKEEIEIVFDFKEAGEITAKEVLDNAVTFDIRRNDEEGVLLGTLNTEKEKEEVYEENFKKKFKDKIEEIKDEPEEFEEENDDNDNTEEEW